MARGKRNKFTNLVEYIPLRIAIGIVDILPIKVSLALSKGVGVLAWWALPNRRKLAINNILLAGVTDDKKEARRIARKSIVSFSMLNKTSPVFDDKILPINS